MVYYRNARVKLLEILVFLFIAPSVLAAIPMIILWKNTIGFFLTFALIYLMIGFNIGFFLWDTRKISHTVIFEDDKVILKMRAYENTYRWDEVDDILWKRVVFKRSV